MWKSSESGALEGSSIALMLRGGMKTKMIVPASARSGPSKILPDIPDWAPAPKLRRRSSAAFSVRDDNGVAVPQCVGGHACENDAPSAGLKPPLRHAVDRLARRSIHGQRRVPLYSVSKRWG
jgi:hypothetical protein